MFQLILSDSMPKTGYLTPMHEFIIVSTFYTVLAMVESVAAYMLNKRKARRDAVIARFALGVNNKGKDKLNMLPRPWGGRAAVKPPLDGDEGTAGAGGRGFTRSVRSST